MTGLSTCLFIAMRQVQGSCSRGSHSWQITSEAMGAATERKDVFVATSVVDSWIFTPDDYSDSSGNSVVQFDKACLLKRVPL
ncbi:uncharacterized protein LOC5520056 [Nematostella vectensis]|uniref:uncharacterized protein LOC5520056 n=1 Tax=Nematostella vectensis TaxID=45351 RepID=UPI002076DF32|nr:uncharacterized protein LOC5520056 [Nematostella vectensis]